MSVYICSSRAAFKKHISVLYNLLRNQCYPDNYRRVGQKKPVVNLNLTRSLNSLSAGSNIECELFNT